MSKEAHLNDQRGTHHGTLITHTAAGAGTVNGPIFPTSAGLGMLVFIRTTAITGTSPTLTVTVRGLIDGEATDSYVILASAAITANGLVVLRIYPGLTAAANLTASDVVPSHCRIDTVIGGTGPAVTATVSAYSLTAG